MKYLNSAAFLSAHLSNSNQPYGCNASKGDPSRGQGRALSRPLLGEFQKRDPFAELPTNAPDVKSLSHLSDITPDQPFEANGIVSSHQAKAMQEAVSGAVQISKMDSRSHSANQPSFSTQIPGLLKMARLNAVPLAAGLVGFGAFGARELAPSPLDAVTKGQLALSTLLTIMVTTNSMLINDLYDWSAGVDTVENKPDRALVSGEVTPETVKHVLQAKYAAILTLLCFVDRPATRLFILSNTLLTFFYSEHLKPKIGLKNLTCASVVSMAVGLGAMAVGGGVRALSNVWRPMAVVGGSIWHREMIMDIKDSEGDKKAGVNTVPAVLGDERALDVSLVPLVFSLVAAATAPGNVARLVSTVSVLTQAVLSLDSRRRDFDQASLNRAIELAPAWMVAALVALTV